ncbi:TPA: phage tail tape measure protein [Mannheimia haemolytica]|uniref:Phage tail tape measure protein, TP901 family, core region n=3 Tax=Mannheimia haemolytica TaxID=75985 RepID=A0A378NIA9_MANHA|nr:phage tail tape measure protein [Mannheimia haemolytica]AGQ39552.1 phage tail length tape measure protein [Mannheimia haemolytica D171]EEY10284.1 bacteriophage tail length determination protein [Mannheimia haemolytica serotype A2 str. OVINE]KYL17235.1 phage tail length tape measure protein [Mannheimia haemolytica]KYL22286.1 phage tail length tape measure protein [Mannheimia haemolytica]MDW0535565.1 phage tail tape measure protein [Mannheimia haemolytica]
MAKNMKVQLELTAKDTASPVLNQAAKTTEKAFKNTERAAQQSGNAQTQAAQKAANATESSNRKIEQSYRNARRVAADVSRARETLGVRAENAIQREIEQTRAAYDRLKRSGVASQNELRRASEATKKRVQELNAELGKTSFGDKAGSFGRGLMGAGVGIAAGAAMARQPARNQMEFDRQLAMVANTAFSDRDVKGRIDGKRELLDAVQKAVSVGGGSKEEALSSLDALLASGAVSTETALNLLPTLQKGAVATGASANDMAQIAISSMQQFGIKEEDIGRVLDMAVAAGQAGSFELANMASWLPQQMAAAKQAGLSGIEGFERLLIANQQARVTAGTSNEAGNNLVNLLGKITAKETNERFKNIEYKDPKTGKTKAIDFAKAMEHYKGKGQDSLQAFMSIMDDVVGSDKRYQELQAKLKTAKGEDQKRLFNELTNLVEGTAIGEIISDRQALMALLGIKNNVQLGEKVQKDIQNSEGAVETSHAVIRDTNSHKVEALKNATEFAQMENFEKVNGVLGTLAEHLTSYANQYPNLTQFVSGATDAVKIFGAALAASSVLDLLTGKKGNDGGMGDLFDKSSKATGSKGKVSKFLSVGGSFASVAGVATMLHGDQAPMSEERKAQLNDPNYQARQMYEYKKEILGSRFHSFFRSNETLEQYRKDVSAYEAKQKNGNTMGAVQGVLSTIPSLQELRPKVDSVTQTLSTYQADFQAFGATLSAGIEAGLASQSHTIANQITVELDGSVVAEKVAEYQFNFNKRMA